jgi:hypothetical protein
MMWRLENKKPLGKKSADEIFTLYDDTDGDGKLTRKEYLEQYTPDEKVHETPEEKIYQQHEVQRVLCMIDIRVPMYFLPSDT